MRKLMSILSVFVLFFVVVAYGDEAVIAAPTYLDNILKFIESGGGITTSLLLMAEILFRLVPTSKPLSVLVPVKYAVDGLGKILSFSATLIDGLIAAANNIKK